MTINNANITGEKLQEFIKCVSLLSEVEFLGVAQILTVKITGEDKKPRLAEEILSDMIDTFVFLNRQKRRDLMKILKQITKKRKSRADILEDSEAKMTKEMGDILIKQNEEKKAIEADVDAATHTAAEPSKPMMEEIDGRAHEDVTPEDGE